MKAKRKTFDCVEMKRKGAEKIQRQIGRMSREEELAFWKEGTRHLKEQKEVLRSTGQGAREVSR